jgi:hypothetical protein
VSAPIWQSAVRAFWCLQCREWHLEGDYEFRAHARCVDYTLGIQLFNTPIRERVYEDATGKCHLWRNARPVNRLLPFLEQ